MSDKFSARITQDGSFTFFSSEFGETFHSQSGAKQEAEKKFVEPCQLIAKAQTRDSIKILDICYGLGYNLAAALAAIWQVNPHCYVEVIALECDRAVPSQAIDNGLLDGWRSPIPELLQRLAIAAKVDTPQLKACLWFGDARETIRQVEKLGFLADAIFFDPFSPPKCPQLWTVEFLRIVARCLQTDGRLVTYSCAASVRTALILAELKVGASHSVGRRSPGTVASWKGEDLMPLSMQEKEHLQTRAAIPYRDPLLADNALTILQRRLDEQQNSSLEPTSRWKKRWAKPPNNTGVISVPLHKLP